MIGDLKTAHLLRSSPKAVFGSQLCGAIVSIFMAAGVYVVFSTAYPCINNLGYATCSFPTPDVQSWRVRCRVLFVDGMDWLMRSRPSRLRCRPRRYLFLLHRGIQRSD